MQLDEIQFDKESFERFLEKKFILLVDPSTSYRKIIIDSLRHLGCPKKNILYCGTYEKAEVLINEKQPEIIISEYEFMQQKNGLELKKIQTDALGDDNNIFIIITTESSNLCVVEAAEEEVDSYMLKPLSQISLITNLRDTFEATIHQQLICLSFVREKCSLQREIPLKL